MADDELKLRITPEVDEDALKRIGDELDRLHKPLGAPTKPSAGASDAIKKDIQTRIDLRDLELRRIQSASAEEIKFLQQRASQGKITTTQMVADIQLVENAQEVATQNALKDYNALQSEIMRTTELTKAQATALQKKLFFAQERASTGFVSMSRSMGGLQANTKDANIAFANFGRIVQDAPFGILGISNNIDPLLNSFAQLKASTGGATGALKAMLAVMRGPLGLIFLLGSVLPSAAVMFERSMQRNKKATQGAKDEMDSYADSLKSAASSQLSGIIPSTTSYAEQVEILRSSIEGLTNASVKNNQVNGEFVNRVQKPLIGSVQDLTLSLNNLNVAQADATRQVSDRLPVQAQIIDYTFEETEAVREIIQAKLNEARANQAIEDALKRLGITRRKSAEEIKKELEERLDIERKILELQFIRDGKDTNALQRFMRDRLESAKETAIEQADNALEQANRVGEGELNITRRTILARTQLYKEGEQVISDAMTTGSKLRVMLLENEQQGLIEMMDLSTSIARNAFGDTKAVAVAEALVNTYVGVSRALREYAPPLSGIMAGLQLANGLATVDRIRRTQIGSAPSGGSGAVNQSASIASATQRPFVTDAISPTGANIAGRIGAMNNQPQFNVTATVDRMGLALAVRDGESDISTRQIPFAS
jgi:hypothetical protein